MVLASFGSLEAGPSRHLFTEWAEDPKNLIVLTSRGDPGSLSQEVRLESEKPPGARAAIDVQLSKRVPLAGDELEQWRLKRKGERLSKQQKMEEKRKQEEEEVENTAMDVDETKTEEPAAAAAAESLLGVAQISGASTRAAELRRRRCLIDGFEPPANAAAPMFPDERWAPQVDDFGEAVDVEVFARAMVDAQNSTGKSDAAIAQAEGTVKTAVDAANALHKKQITKKPIPPPAPPPMPEEAPDKVVVDTLKITLRAAVHVCDYEGRADGRSVRTLLTRVEPRKVVLVHGTEENTKYLQESLQQALGPSVEIDTPSVGETIECTSDVATYGLELSQDLLQTTRLRECAGYQVGWIDGVVAFAKNANGVDVPVLIAPPKELNLLIGDAGLKKNSTDEEGALDDGGDPTTPARVEDAKDSAAATVAIASQASKERRESAFVGDLKLTDFKIVLASHGITAEFKGGALVCSGGAVCVRKVESDENENQSLQVEGALSDDFYKVRMILYNAYQI